ncbi:hypothetical protein CERSUDRAFT_101589 [Gelatoporia subvermispora B]|uniref:Uncharacterized protein n=1 Tax=Ceriporiopsis subvermispora (strain B) TaxID=914234 RepID=M2Q0B4_CERS8|nr:hypothetical protein CERSUDRAFT_101589 [Gelatoporia subvermispora B]
MDDEDVLLYCLIDQDSDSDSEDEETQMLSDVILSVPSNDETRLTSSSGLVDGHKWQASVIVGGGDTSGRGGPPLDPTSSSGSV